MRLKIYYMQIDVAFQKALEVSRLGGNRSRGIVRGFIQEFGYTASSASEARAFVREIILNELCFEVAVSISFDWIGVIKEDALEDEVYSDQDIVNSASFTNPTIQGLWYKSGRAFY